VFKLNSINSSKKNIAIIGAGWFGCYIAYDLIKMGYKVKIFEKENKIFKGASGFNQNRLHQGFHYPRSYKTIKESKAGFNEFIKIFPNLVKKIKKNLYVVVDNKNNLIDFEIYKQILKSNKLNFKIEKKNYGLKNYLGIISCNERLIDKKKAIEFFSNNIGQNIKFNSNIKKIIKKKDFFIIDNLKFNFVINCSWQTSFPARKIKYTYEACLFFLYTCKDRNHPAITLMAGPFVTLYPAEKNIFTLYSVKYTRLKKFNKFSSCTRFTKNIKKEVIDKSRLKHEAQIRKYYPDFNNKFKFYKHTITYRTIIDNANAERSSKVIEKDKFINLLSGKIDHIFQSSKIIKKCLKRY
jgi:hypothetical protein